MALSRSFGALRRRLDIRGKEVVIGVEKKIRRAAIVADQFVVLGTPVDTGRAKSNWLVSLQAPIFEEIPAFSPGSKGSTQTANEQAAIDDGRAVIGQFRLANGSIFISNSLPYIQALEDGSSDQASNGMVKQAVQAAQLEFTTGKVFTSR